jgi:hypothetical protein
MKKPKPPRPRRAASSASEYRPKRDFYPEMAHFSHCSSSYCSWSSRHLARRPAVDGQDMIAAPRSFPRLCWLRRPVRASAGDLGVEERALVDILRPIAG